MAGVGGEGRGVREGGGRFIHDYLSGEKLLAKKVMLL